MFVKWSIRVAIILIFLVAILLLWDFAKKKIFSSEPPQPIITHNITIDQIEAMGKLELVKYKFRDVLEYKVGNSSWYGTGSKILVIISGEAVGCIDLTKIKKEDIIEDSTKLYIKLPPPELCYSKVNHQESKTYDVESGIFGKFNDKSSEALENAYKEAEKKIKELALEANILEQTKKNAELILKPTLEQISKKKVVFKYDLENIKIEKEIKPLK